MTKHELTHESMSGFIGTEAYHMITLNPKMRFTDGALHVAKAGGAYWLMDEIALANMFEPKVQAEAFQGWTLRKRENDHAELTCDDGNGNIVYRKHIEFTDFPLESISLWCTDNVVMLPSEY